MKFKINDDNLYIGYGSDGTIAFDAVFNQGNQPHNHRYVDSKWVLDEELANKQSNEEVYQKLDELTMKWLKNEFRYKDSTSYEEYKLKYEAELEELKSQLK